MADEVEDWLNSTAPKSTTTPSGASSKDFPKYDPDEWLRRTDPERAKFEESWKETASGWKQVGSGILPGLVGTTFTGPAEVAGDIWKNHPNIRAAAMTNPITGGPLAALAAASQAPGFERARQFANPPNTTDLQRAGMFIGGLAPSLAMPELGIEAGAGALAARTASPLARGALRTAGRVGESAASGAIAGALQPTEEGDLASHLQGGGWGAVFGTTGGLAGAGAARAAAYVPPPQKAAKMMYDHILDPLGMQSPNIPPGRIALNDIGIMVTSRLNQANQHISLTRTPQLQTQLNGLSTQLRNSIQTDENKSVFDNEYSRILSRLDNVPINGNLSGQQFSQMVADFDGKARQWRAAAKSPANWHHAADLNAMADSFAAISQHLENISNGPAGAKQLRQQAKQAYARWRQVNRLADPATGLTDAGKLLADDRRVLGDVKFGQQMQNDPYFKRLGELSEPAAAGRLKQAGRALGYVGAHGLAGMLGLSHPYLFAHLGGSYAPSLGRVAQKAASKVRPFGGRRTPSKAAGTAVGQYEGQPRESSDGENQD